MKPSPLCLPADMPELSQSRFRTTAVELGRAIQSKFGGLRKPSKPRLRDRSVVSPVRCRGLSHSDHACAVWRRAVLPRGDAFGLRQSGAGAFPCGPDDNPLRRIYELHTNCRASDPMVASSTEYASNSSLLGVPTKLAHISRAPRRRFHRNPSGSIDRCASWPAGGMATSRASSNR
jgi:hypothetical protein